MRERALIGLFGGTFDPVHIGHLRMALELKQQLGMDEMRLLPCHIPPHRNMPLASAEHRAAMTELAVAACPELVVDRLELGNDQPSFSIHTLEVMRERLGPEVALCLSMGMDSFVGLNQWHRWRDLLGLAHIAVAARPGWILPAAGEVVDLLGQHSREAADLRKQAQGCILIQELSLLPVSATQIRSDIARGRSPQFLVPDSVWAYILRNNLYR